MVKLWAGMNTRTTGTCVMVNCKRQMSLLCQLGVLTLSHFLNIASQLMALIV